MKIKYETIESVEKDIKKADIMLWVLYVLFIIYLILIWKIVYIVTLAQ
mgnify:CR=1 FL=1